MPDNERDFDWSTVYVPGETSYFKFDEIGDSVAGVVCAKPRKVKFENREHEVVVIDIQPRDGESVSVVCGNVDLARQVKGLKVQKGDKLAIKFTGREPNGRGGTMHRFAVRHEPLADSYDDGEEPF